MLQDTTPPSDHTTMNSLDHTPVSGSPFHAATAQSYNLQSSLAHEYDLSSVTGSTVTNGGGSGGAGGNSSSSSSIASVNNNTAVSSVIRDIHHQQQQQQQHLDVQQSLHQQQQQQQQQQHTSSANLQSHQDAAEGSNGYSVLPSLLPCSSTISSYPLPPLQDFTTTTNRQQEQQQQQQQQPPLQESPVENDLIRDPGTDVSSVSIPRPRSDDSLMTDQV